MFVSCMRIIVALSGASGMEIGVRLAEELNKNKAEVHAVVSAGAKEVMKHECRDGLKRIGECASRVYGEDDIGAAPASGSFKADGMIVAPCSMKTLASIACGYSSNLVGRAADVSIKQKRKLVLVPREIPFSSIHLENMLKLSNLGVFIVPPVLGLYHEPKKIGDVVDYVVGRILEVFGIEHDLYRKWGE